LADRFITLFSFDLRAIALFRISLGLLIIANLYFLAFDLRAFYSNNGILPLNTWSSLSNLWQWSLHAISGATVFQALLFAASAVVAMLLCLGYKTRLMAVLNWVLLISLINRNPFVLQAGDQLLAVLSFWAIFLPMQARYSIDAALRAEHERAHNTTHAIAQQRSVKNYGVHAQNQYFSMATVAVSLQILYVYFFSAILKSDAVWRDSMDAAFYVLSLEHYVTPLGAYLREFTGFLKIATGYVLTVEFIGPLLALALLGQTQLRLIALCLFASLHFAFLLSLHMGLFPLIGIAALLLLLPPVVFNSVSNWRNKKRRWQEKQAINIYYDQDCGFCLKMTLVFRALFLPAEVQIAPAQSVARIGEILERENSWVVTDHRGKVYLHWYAVQFVISQCWWAKPLAWFLKIPPLMRIGNRLYAGIGNNRTRLGKVTARFLPYKSVTVETPFFTQLLAVFFLVLVTTSNIAGVPAWGQRPVAMSVILQATGLDQHWGMFAPKPPVYSTYPVIEGSLRNGDKVDLFYEQHSPAKRLPPAANTPVFSNYRWRTIFEGINAGTPQVQHAYADYLCRRWNTPARPDAQQLTSIDIASLRKQTTTIATTKEVIEKRLSQHGCNTEMSPMQSTQRLQK